jgi:hypothetical protein
MHQAVSPAAPVVEIQVREAQTPQLKGLDLSAVMEDCCDAAAPTPIPASTPMNFNPAWESETDSPFASPFALPQQSSTARSDGGSPFIGDSKLTNPIFLKVSSRNVYS